ncbi:ATP-binding protein [Streptomyces monashensis]|uniref:ATP-binding protein n=1 Tax=Streptomyces monashensis TaxID=1678012 RepID=UPI0033E979D7
MAVTALGPEILDELRAGRSPDIAPRVVDDLALTIDRESVGADGEVRSSTAVWVGRLRRIGRAKLNAWGLSALVDDAELLISELVTNGFRHGTEREITFRLVIGTDVLVLEVDDGSFALPVLRDAGPEELNGRGLKLVSAVAASWGVSSDGTKTWCTLKFPARKGRSQ